MTRHLPCISELGHVGIRCFDTSKQLDFYTRVLGLTVTDHDEDLGVWFLSARPDTEHHEVLLATGRDASVDAKLIQQISFRCDEFADVLGFFRRFRDENVTLDMVVSHGNAVGVYFYDPEGNRCEVYWQTGFDARQPFVQHINIETDFDELIANVQRSVREFGESGFAEPSYISRTKNNNQSEEKSS